MHLEAFLYFPVPSKLNMAEWVYASNKTNFYLIWHKPSTFKVSGAYQEV